MRILGAGATSLDVALVDDWAATHATTSPRALPASDLSAFGLGEALSRVHAMLEGRTSLSDLTARVRSPDARTNFLRLLYLLVETDAATLA
jgi:hypothetical protein